MKLKKAKQAEVKEELAIVASVDQIESGTKWQALEGHKLNWVPDLPDYRDHLFSQHAPIVHAKLLKTPPSKVDLRKYAGDVQDQGELGSCTAQAFASLLEMNDRRKKHVDYSRLFIYYNERAYINEIHNDSGAYIRDGVKSLVEYGYALESKWKHDLSKFTVKPPASVYKDAAKRKIEQYMRLKTLADMKQCLAMGFPFVFGFTVYDNFFDVGRNGQMQMPKGNMLGGHAVLAVGYDDSANVFIIQNSWGKDWGDGGFFFMPTQYIQNPGLTSDFWHVRSN